MEQSAKIITLPTIRLRHKTEDRVVLFNVEDAAELCRTNWEVFESKDESILETADDLAAEEAAGEKIDESAPNIDAESEIADNKSEVISSDAVVADKVIMPAE